MKNVYCEVEGVQLEGSQIKRTLFYVYFERLMDMENDIKDELDRRQRAAWAAFRSALYVNFFFGNILYGHFLTENFCAKFDKIVTEILFSCSRFAVFY